MQSVLQRAVCALALLLVFGTAQPAISAQSASGAQQSNGDPSAAAPSTPSQASEPTSTPDRSRVVVEAVRLDEPLTIDGQLTEAVYTRVAPYSNFIQQEPLENQPASERTDVWVLFDRDTLYVAARNVDSQMDRIIINELRHDSSNLIQNDHLAITLDSFNDKRNGFIFLVTALGGMLEETFVDERNASRDWNTVWNARTTRTADAWFVEVAIPFKSLRYPPGTGHDWGVQVNRVIRHKNERAYLSPVPRSFGAQAVFRVSAAAALVGLNTPPLSKNLQIKPYAIAGLATDRTATPRLDNDFDRDAGIDVKYGLTRSLTADLTVNTDFAQVEDDEQQVNLTRFTLLFPEKREFFLEGQGIFNFGGRAPTGAGDTPVMFFSRQIGLDNGRPVPIRAGGRLTGRAGAYTLGAVNIQTDDVPATGTPTTNFTVLRARRDVLRRSSLGVIYTGRTGAPGQGRSESYGVDGIFSLKSNVRLDTYLARTSTPGRTGDDLSYRGLFDYNADRYGLAAEHLAVGADFSPAVGFMRRRNFRRTATDVRFSPRPSQARLVRKYYYEGSFSYITTGTGRLESRAASLAHRIEFQNSDRINIVYLRSYELLVAPFRIIPTVTIPVGGYGWQSVEASYQLGTQRRFNGTLSASTGSFYGGSQTAASYRGRIAVLTQLALEPQISANWIDLPQGRFTTTLLSTRATAPLTPRMFVSALLQYNSTSQAFNSNVRLRWEYKLGSELFVVYSEGRNSRLTGSPDLETRGLVVKVTRLLRL